MTNVMTKEILKYEQLEQVAGGTFQETDELIRAIGMVDVRVKTSHTHYQTSYSTEHRQLKRDEVENYHPRRKIYKAH